VPSNFCPNLGAKLDLEISGILRPRSRSWTTKFIDCTQPRFQGRNMDRNDKTAIEALFGKLEEVERQAPPRDIESESFIHERIRRQPGSPYFMAQTIIVQEQALRGAQERIAELEAQAAQTSSRAARTPTSGISVPRIGRGSGAGSQRAGGGFLAGAAQTAMGVAGGLLLGNALGGMFGSSDAAAADSGHGAQDAPADEAGFEDDGDFGDMEF
jgi:uncharacterized protein